uniref:Uncharacterized protein n=1 Tax=Acrobeloides nanus TaxID=290746 RepID=A0A914DY93_9BILA
MLSNSDKLSIKLKDPHMHNVLVNHWTRNTNFQSITFLIRNEENRKQTLMIAELQSGIGIFIKTAAGKPIMTVRTPNSSDSLGKIMHPAQATLYKIVKTIAPVGEHYLVLKTPTQEPAMRIEKVLVSMYPIGKAVGLIGTSCVYWLKRMDGTILGYIRPKLVHKSNTLVLKFSSTEKDEQTRAMMLGVTMLFMITEAYPQLRVMLEESVKKNDPLRRYI